MIILCYVNYRLKGPAGILPVGTEPLMQAGYVFLQKFKISLGRAEGSSLFFLKWECKKMIN